LPPFRARRMNWLEHPILRKRHGLAPPQLSPLPPLTPIAIRSPMPPGDDDGFINPDDIG
jgi:hypothetical protein